MQSVTDNNIQSKQIHPNNSNVETRKRLHLQFHDFTLKDGWYLHQFLACPEEKKNLAVKQNPPKMGEGYSKP